MAGKAKSVYLTVTPKGSPCKRVLSKEFFDAKACRDYLATEEFKAKYPADQFDIVKETY